MINPTCYNCGRPHKTGERWFEVQIDSETGTYKIIPYWFFWSNPHRQFCRGNCVGAWLSSFLEGGRYPC